MKYIPYILIGLILGWNYHSTHADQPQNWPSYSCKFTWIYLVHNRRFPADYMTCKPEETR